MIPRKERKVFSRKERKDFAGFAWNKTLAKVQFKEVSSSTLLHSLIKRLLFNEVYGTYGSYGTYVFHNSH
jgi:hypothetical protein